MKNFKSVMFAAVIGLVAALGVGCSNAHAGDVWATANSIQSTGSTVYRGEVGARGDVTDNLFVDGALRTLHVAHNGQNYTSEAEFGGGVKLPVGIFTPYARAFYVVQSQNYGFEVGSKVAITQRIFGQGSFKRFVGSGNVVNRDEGRVGAGVNLGDGFTVAANYLIVKTAAVPNAHGAELSLSKSF